MGKATGRDPRFSEMIDGSSVPDFEDDLSDLP